jgi:hypothetical protein
MVIGKLRVETQEKIPNNPFYGTYVRKNVVEHKLEFKKHENVSIPPCGIIGEIKLGDTIMNIEINKYFFDHTENGWAETSFCVEGKVYSIDIKFNNDEIDYVELCEWDSKEDFLDDEDPINRYNIKDFTKIDKYVC